LSPPRNKLYTGGVRWRWVFSSSLLPSSRLPGLPDGVRRTAEKAFCGLFQLVFPDDCRVCGKPLREVSRIPVCSPCLNDPQPLAAEHYCAACRMPFLNSFPLNAEGLCALCRLGLSGFDAAYTYGSYEGSLRKLIHLFKYGGVQPLARPFGKLMAQALPRELEVDAIVPMPLHWRRRWTRGFNQSALLAREVSKRWNVPVLNAMRRTRSTAAQSGLSNAKRRKNVSGAFKVKKRMDGMRILLIDDVLTTGASASSCARALKRAGARHVCVLALARTDRRMMLSVLEEQASFMTASAGGKR
jgi:ComF family protein